MEVNKKFSGSENPTQIRVLKVWVLKREPSFAAQRSPSEIGKKFQNEINKSVGEWNKNQQTATKTVCVCVCRWSHRWSRSHRWSGIPLCWTCWCRRWNGPRGVRMSSWTCWSTRRKTWMLLWKQPENGYKWETCFYHHCASVTHR